MSACPPFATIDAAETLLLRASLLPDTAVVLSEFLKQFLVPVIASLATDDQQCRSKLLELLVHIDRRIRARMDVALPFTDLLIQWESRNQLSSQPSFAFVDNFNAMFLEMAFKRVTMQVAVMIKANSNFFQERTQAINILLNGVSKRNSTIQEKALTMVVSVLENVVFPEEPVKEDKLSWLRNPDDLAIFLEFSTDIILSLFPPQFYNEI